MFSEPCNPLELNSIGNFKMQIEQDVKLKMISGLLLGGRFGINHQGEKGAQGGGGGELATADVQCIAAVASDSCTAGIVVYLFVVRFFVVLSESDSEVIGELLSLT